MRKKIEDDQSDPFRRDITEYTHGLERTTVCFARNADACKSAVYQWGLD